MPLESRLRMRSTEIAHFYLGRVSDGLRLTQFLAEHYGEDDEDAPLSEFYGSQGEQFCDHDFLESGLRLPGQSLEDFFAPYSYAQSWSGALCRAARAAGLDDANVLIFINHDQIAAPRAVHVAGLALHYMGTLEYAI